MRVKRAGKFGDNFFIAFIITLKKTSNKTDMAFSLKVMDLITCILFYMKKTIKKNMHTFCKRKIIVPDYKYIHVHLCTFLITDIRR